MPSGASASARGPRVSRQGRAWEDWGSRRAKTIIGNYVLLVHEKLPPQRIFFRRCAISPRPAHSLITEATPNVAPDVAAFRIRPQKLLISPPRQYAHPVPLTHDDQHYHTQL